VRRPLTVPADPDEGLTFTRFPCLVLIPIRRLASDHLTFLQPVELAAHHALNDLCALELGYRAENSQGDFALGDVFVIDAVDDDLLAVADELAVDAKRQRDDSDGQRCRRLSFINCS
jgi:hypothetical protein